MYVIKNSMTTEHLPGAISLPRAAIELEIDELVPNQDTLHCRALWRQHPRGALCTPPYKLWDTRTLPY